MPSCWKQNNLLNYESFYRSPGSFPVRWKLHPLANQIAKTPLLILNDFGLQPLDHDRKLALLQMVLDRYAKGANIITSQLPVKTWYEHLKEPTLADAIMDRVTA